MNHILHKIVLLLITLVFVGCGTTSQQANIQSGAQETVIAKNADAPLYSSSASFIPAPAAQKSTRLGTQWGEGVTSVVSTVNLRRSSNTPIDIAEIHYSAETNRGRSVNEMMMANGRIGFSLLNLQNKPMPLVQSGQKHFLKGKAGERYQLFYRNYSDNTYEIVATVDGLDVLNGSAGSLRNSGYVLGPHKTLVIEGFRKSQSEVAAFRFSSASDAYAANTPAGSIKNTGIIGSAVFSLYDPTRKISATKLIKKDDPQAFPADNKGYAPPPSYRK